MSDLKYFWSTPVFIKVNENTRWMNESLKMSILHKESKEKEGLKRSNYGGWHSDDDLINWIADMDRIDLIRIITETESVFKTLLNQQATKYIMKAWANVNRNGDYNTIHSHPNFQISGVYYVSDGEPDESVESNGYLELLDPRTAATHCKIKGMDFGNFYGIKPQNGMIVLFPSFVEHWVHPFQGKSERISIAFNIKF